MRIAIYFLTIALNLIILNYSNSANAVSDSVTYAANSVGGATLGGATLWMMYHPSAEKVWNHLSGYRSFKKWEAKHKISKALCVVKHITKISLSVGAVFLGYHLTALASRTLAKKTINEAENHPLFKLTDLNEKRRRAARNYSIVNHDYNKTQFLVLGDPGPDGSIEKVKEAFEKVQEAETEYRRFIVEVIGNNSHNQLGQDFIENVRDFDSIFHKENRFFFVDTKMPEEIDHNIGVMQRFLAWKERGQDVTVTCPEGGSYLEYEIPVINYQNPVSVGKALKAPHRDVNRVLTALYLDRVQVHADRVIDEGRLKEQYDLLGSVIDLSRYGFDNYSPQILEYSKQIHFKICNIYSEQFDDDGDLIHENGHYLRQEVI